MSQVKSEVGNRYGKLVVISFSHSDKYPGYSRTYWNCTCDCGNQVKVRRDHLTRGKTRSCGCVRKDKRGHRTPIGQSSFNKLYGNYKSSAKTRNLVFELSKEKFAEIIKQDCYYCGSPPSGFYSVKNLNGGILYNGIDRVRSSEGYTLENSVPCCGMCNRAKIDMDISDFELWIHKLVERSLMNKEGSFYANRESA